MEIKKVERGFTGVWIPREIWESKEFSMTEKCLLIEIESLSKLEKGCFASNQTLGDHLGLSKKTVANLISGLAKRELLIVTLTYHPGTKIVDKRFIKLTDKFKFIKAGIDRNKYKDNSNEPIPEKMNRGIPKKVNRTIPENGKVTNTVFNKTKKTTTSEENSSSSIYEFLKLEEFSRVNQVTKKNLSRIEGLTYESFKKVYNYTLAKDKKKPLQSFNRFLFCALNENWEIEENVEKAVKKPKKDVEIKEGLMEVREFKIKKVTQKEYLEKEAQHLKTYAPSQKEFAAKLFKRNFEIID